MKWLKPLQYISQMNTTISFLISLFLLNAINAQEIVCSAKDKEVFKSKISELKNSNTANTSIEKTIIAVGSSFLGTPYVAKTLEIDPNESLVVNFQGLDCTTFVENVVAFSLMLKNNEDDFDSYTYYLQKIRYRDGILDGYGSRLHYFSEWISNNEKKGILKDITGGIGGKELKKNINFMSTHRELYPFLKNDKNFDRIKQSEARINQSYFCYLPKDQINDNESFINSGDIIAITTSIEGLDISHTGIAIRQKTGRIHLLHASTSGKVLISKVPLATYLQKLKNNTGIIVSRIQ